MLCLVFMGGEYQRTCRSERVSMVESHNVREIDAFRHKVGVVAGRVLGLDLGLDLAGRPHGHDRAESGHDMDRARDSRNRLADQERIGRAHELRLRLRLLVLDAHTCSDRYTFLVHIDHDHARARARTHNCTLACEDRREVVEVEIVHSASVSGMRAITAIEVVRP
jgi:hypothetical protein